MILGDFEVLVLAASRPAPVWPAGTEIHHASSAAAPLWVVVALLAVAAVLVGAVVSFLAWRDERRQTPEHRALLALCRAMELGRADRILILHLAAAAGVPAVALVLSEPAFRDAARLTEAGQFEGRPSTAQVASTARRLFSTRSDARAVRTPTPTIAP